VVCCEDGIVIELADIVGSAAALLCSMFSYSDWINSGDGLLSVEPNGRVTKEVPGVNKGVPVGSNKWVPGENIISGLGVRDWKLVMTAGGAVASDVLAWKIPVEVAFFAIFIFLLDLSISCSFGMHWKKKYANFK
jgi:hypothetical protein